MIHFADGESELFIDETLAPIMVLTWIGPATLSLTHEFLRWVGAQIEAARASDGLLVLINDASETGRPSAEVRRAFAENRLDSAVILKTFVVVTNPLVRGAMTAISWLVGDQFNVITCETMREALAKAVTTARTAGIAVASDQRVAAYLAVAPVAGGRRR